MKRVLCILVALAMIFSLAACASTPAEPDTEPKEEPAKEEPKAEPEPEAEPEPTPEPKKFTLKFSMVSVPGDAHTEAVYVFRDAIEDSTNGQIRVEIYHSGSLYGQGADMEALLSGNLECGYTSAAWLAEFVPSISMFTAGYIFKDYDHMTKVLNGDIGKQVFETVSQELPIVPLSAFYLGSRQINVRGLDRDILTPEDLEGVKLRMPNTPAWLFLGEALGANPTPLSFSELYMALSTGTVDGQDNPLPTVKNAKFYEVTDQISLTNHLVDQVWFAVNKDVWEEMGPELQEKMYAAVEEARKACDAQNLKSEAELVEFFKGEGMKVVEPDIDAFMETVQAAYLENKEITKDWDMDLFEQVKGLAD